MKGKPETIFADPIGSSFRLADFEEIVDLLKTKAEDYWNSPAENGLASLTFCPNGWVNDDDDCPQTAQMDFTKLDARGFHFYYSYHISRYSSPYYRESESFFSCSTTSLTSRRPISWAGEGQHVFDALFVDTATAVEIVREFLATGRRSANAQWLCSSEVVKREQEIE